MPIPVVLARGLIVVGGAISLLEFVRLARLYLRFYRAWKTIRGDRKAASAARLEVAYEASKQAVLACVGVTLTLLGLIMTGVIPSWILVAPALICVSAAGNALVFRWGIRRLRG